MSGKRKNRKIKAKNKPEPKREYEVGYGKPPKSAQWQKGQSGNPRGGQAHDPDLKRLRKLTTAELAEVTEFIINKDVGDLKDFVKNDENNVLQRMVASVAARVIAKGDMFAFDCLLDRLIGKVKPHDPFGGLGSPAPASSVQVIVSLPSNGREVKAPVAESA